MEELWKGMGTQMEHLRTALEAFWSGLVSFLPHLLSAALILLLGLIASRLLPRPFNAMLKRTNMDPVAVKYLLRALRIVIWSLVSVMALDKLGVPVSSLLAVVAAVGAAVALAIRDNLSNLASGIVLLFTKPFKAGRFHRGRRPVRHHHGNRADAHLSGYSGQHARRHPQYQNDDRFHPQLLRP